VGAISRFVFFCAVTEVEQAEKSGFAGFQVAQLVHMATVIAL
jgi:hypothetical protein